MQKSQKGFAGHADCNHIIHQDIISTFCILCEVVISPTEPTVGALGEAKWRKEQKGATSHAMRIVITLSTKIIFLWVL